jgi:uncharacterized membrane protein (DUF2068 family)
MAKQQTQGSEMQHGRTRHRHDRWLIIIGTFKILEGVFFVLLGLGIVRLLHRDIGDMLLRAALALRIDPESHFVNLLLDKVQLLTPHKMRLISAGIFLKAGLDFVEGIGLALEKSWAEWLTIGLTASFLPWEVFEIIRRFTWVKVGLTLLNVLVLLYLLWVQQLRLRAHHRAQ